MPSSGSQIIVFDRNRHYLTELGALTRRDWALNAWGECRFDLGTNNPKFQENILQYGNYVLVRHPTLPDWVGVIDTPRTWQRMRAEVSAVGAEKYFMWRHALSVDENNYISKIPMLSGTYGSVFRQLINLLNKPEKTGIVAGDIFDGGPTTHQKLTGYLGEALREMATRSKHYWDVTPVYSTHSSVLSMEANWYAKKGSLSPIILEEGSNIEQQDKPMTEEGEIGTEILAIGDTGVDAAAFAARRISSTSDDFGLRQRLLRLTGINQLTSVAAHAEKAVEHFSVPRINFRVSVIDPDIYSWMVTGNEFTLVLKTVGFHDDGKAGWTGQVMVTGVHYADFNNLVTLDVKRLNEITWSP